MEIELKEITKYYGKFRALDRINVTLRNGVYGLLGPNGAGKTTLLNILVGLLPASSGEILCNGKKTNFGSKEYLSGLGYMPQMPAYYRNYTARDFLHYIGALKALSKQETENRTEELLALVGLQEEATKKVGAMSGGMRQRLGIAQAMMNDPGLLIMDEPTAGIDPKERIRFRNILSKIASDRIVLISTHIVSDIEYTADYVMLLRKGKLILVDSVDNTCRTVEGKVYEAETTGKEITGWIDRYPNCSVINNLGNYRVRILSDTPVPGTVRAVPTLEDVFIYYFSSESEGVTHADPSI
ncbi:MAG: ATP-binding cassette domain-containing protein [Eubacteriales bacterium]